MTEWVCPACGERAAAQDERWVEHVRSTHRCPSPERQKVADRITLALQGAYDG